MKFWPLYSIRKLLRLFSYCLVAVLMVLFSQPQARVVAATAPIKVSNNLIYSWWIQPIATELNGSTYFGGVTSGGAWRTFKKTGNALTNNIVDYAPEADDHNAPAMLVNPGKPTLLFYARHGKSNYLNYERAAAGTIDFVDQGNIRFPKNVTYAQALSEGDKVVVLTRTSNCRWSYILSEDYGITWSSPRVLIEACETDNKVYVLTEPSLAEPIVIYPHPTESDWREIAYGKIDVSSGNITSSEGVVGNLDEGDPIAKEDLDEVNPTQSSDQRTRLLDVGQVDGKPIIFYAKWDTSLKPRYYSAIQNSDGSFERRDLGVASGRPFFGEGVQEYVGGIAYDTANQLAYISAEEAGTWAITRYNVNADGSIQNPSTIASDILPLVRPYVIKNSNDILYQRLLMYQKFTIFRSQTWMVQN